MNSIPRTTRFQGLKLYCCRHALGRVGLHLACICCGGKVSFHLAGVRREMRVFKLGT